MESEDLGVNFKLSGIVKTPKAFHQLNGQKILGFSQG